MREIDIQYRTVFFFHSEYFMTQMPECLEFPGRLILARSCRGVAARALSEGDSQQIGGILDA